MILYMFRSGPRVGVLPLNILVASGSFLTSAQSDSPKSHELSTATETRLIDPGWWPTKGTAPRDQYVGSETCGRCHQDMVAAQRSTPMAHARKAATADAFTKRPQLMQSLRGRSHSSVLPQTPRS